MTKQDHKNVESLFPNNQINLVICVSGRGNKTPFSALMVDMIFDLGLLGGTQGFPMFLYEDITGTQGGLWSA